MPDERPQVSDYSTTSLIQLAKQTATVCGVAGLFVVILLGIATALDVLMMFLMGLLFAIFLHSLTATLNQRTGLGETWSLVVVVSLLLLFSVSCGWFLVPTIAGQMDEFKQKWPESLANLKQWLGTTDWGNWLLRRIPESNQFLPQPQAILSHVPGVVTSAMGFIGVPLVVFFIGLMLAAQPKVYRENFLLLIPPANRSRADEVLEEIGSSLKWWLIAKLIAMMIVGVLTGIGLYFLGIELATTLAVLAALLTFVPNFGPIISVIPAVLLGLMHNPLTALWVVLLYIGIQLFESYIITPWAQSKALSLPPVLVIVAQLAVSAWVGVLGLALATPLLAIVVVLVRKLYIGDVLREGETVSENATDCLSVPQHG